MPRTAAAFVLLALLVPQGLHATSGPYWGSDSLVDTMLRRREARREARARERYDTPPREHQIRMGFRIISNPASPRRRRLLHPALVTGVVDGSILSVNLPAGTNTEVRLLGVDAPEIRRPEAHLECYALRARDALREAFGNASVLLERDSRYNRDSYRRLVRYVRVGTQDIGAWMIWSGYAFADTDVEHLRDGEYLRLEADARQQKRGLWSTACDYNDMPDALDILQ